MGFFDRFRKKKQEDGRVSYPGVISEGAVWQTPEPERPEPEHPKPEPPKKEIPKQEIPVRDNRMREVPVQGESARKIPAQAFSGDKTPAQDIPETVPGLEEEGSLDAGLSESLNVSLSKGSVLEDTIRPENPESLISSDPDSLSNEEIGKGTPILDTYQVLSDAIKGGMGSVWKVLHKGWNKDLAMKRPQPRFFAEGSEERKGKFIRECESWIKLGLHPNIVSCYYVREIGGVPTIFSEWMENGSLKNRIEDGTLYEIPEGLINNPEEGQKALQERLLDIAIQFARGLNYAHESKDHLIHQDVKPDNLLLTKDWEAKVADFGLAHARAQLKEKSGSLSGSGQRVSSGESKDDGRINDRDRGITQDAAEGILSEDATHMAPTGGYTPAYCSFEQFLQEKLTRRTDIYSWAVSVLEMYLGKRPWKKGIEAGRRYDEYCRDYRVAMPGALSKLLRQCLEENPDNRPHDFTVIEEQLRKIYEEISGTEYPRPEPTAAADNPDSLNNRALSYLDLGREEEAGKLWREALDAMPDHLVSIYNQGLYQWRKALIDDEELIRRMAAVRQEKGSDIFPRLLSQINRERGVSEEKLFQESSRGRKIRGSALERVAVSPDGKRLFSGPGESGRKIRCFDTKTLECIYENPGSVSRLAYSKNGNRLLIAHSETVEIVDAGDGKTMVGGKRLHGKGTIEEMRLSPDLRHCYVLHIPYGSLNENPVIRKMDLSSGTCVKEYHSDKYHMINTFEVSRDGKKLFVNTEHGIRAVDERTGVWTELKNRKIRTSVRSVFRVSKDQKCFYVSYVSGLNVWNEPDDGKQILRVIELNYLYLSPDEKRLLTGGKTLKIWDTSDMRCLRTLFPGEDNVTGIAASDDLSLIVTGGKNIRVWDHVSDPEVSPAPWELSVSKSYLETRASQEETENLSDEISSAIDRSDWQKAVSGLLAGEAEYGVEGSAVFRGYRRMLNTRVTRTGILETYENGMTDSGTDGRDRDIAVCPVTGRLAMTVRIPVSRYQKRSVVRILDRDLNPVCDTEEACFARALAFSNSGHLLAAAAGNEVSVFRMEEDGIGAQLMHFTAAEEDLNTPFLRFSPDDSLLLVQNWGYAEEKGTYRRCSSLTVWNMETGEKEKTLHCSSDEEKFEREINDARFTPDLRSVISAECFVSRQGESETRRNRLCYYDLSTGERRLQIRQRKYAVDEEKKEYDQDTRFQRIFFEESTDHAITCLKRSVVSLKNKNSGLNQVSVWDSQTGEFLREGEPSKLEVMAQSPDRKLFAALEGKDVVICTCPDRQELIRFSLPSEIKYVREIVFSPFMSTLYILCDKKLLSRELVWEFNV